MLKWLTVVLVGIVVMASSSGVALIEAQGSNSVTILVVDDFTGSDLEILNPQGVDQQDNCAVNLEGQAFATRGFSADPITMPHGELVYAQLEELRGQVGAADTIDLVRVDIHALNTDGVAAQIADAIADHPADFYIVNMSFAILPCEYVQAFADFGSQLLDARDAKDLNRYRGLFQRAVIFYDQTVFPAMSNKAKQAANLDPLQTLFADLGSRIIPVSSAGNFGLDFPFWPGAWSEVISVSGSADSVGFYSTSAWDKKTDMPLLGSNDEQPGKKLRISNYGEVMMPSIYAGMSGELSGTSFAAPRLSIALAVYVSAVGDGYCRTPDNNPALAYQGWNNLTLQQVVQEYCPGMAGYLP